MAFRKSSRLDPMRLCQAERGLMPLTPVAQPKKYETRTTSSPAALKKSGKCVTSARACVYVPQHSIAIWIAEQRTSDQRNQATLGRTYMRHEAEEREEPRSRRMNRSRPA